MNRPLDSLIDQQLYSVQRLEAPPPDEATSLVIDRVAEVSIAAAAGLTAGDFLVDVNGEPAATVKFEDFFNAEARHQYGCFHPASGERMELEVSGAPIGIKTARSTESLERQIAGRPGPDAECLDPIWVRGEWEALLRAAQKSRGGWLARTFGGRNDSPATLMHGAALYELGDRNEGLALITKYMEDFERNWTTQYQAIGRYYQALELLAKSQQDRAIGLLREAFDFSPLDRIADKIESVAGVRPTKDQRFVGEPFPHEYELSSVSNGGKVRFKEAVERLNPGQVLWVCLLATYRANGPYHEQMLEYRRIATHLKDLVVEKHVLTMEPDVNEFAASWLRGEKAVVSAGLPLEVLHDTGMTTYALQPTHSPMNLLVNDQGTVLFHGHQLDEVSLWEALAKAAAQS